MESNDEEQIEEQQYGRGQRVKHKKGHYKALNKGLVVAVTALIDETQTNDIIESPKQVVEHVLEDANDYHDESYQLPPDIALASFAYLDPKMLDKALRGLDAKQWLEYEISQLEKLGTWVVVDLSVGHTAILLGINMPNCRCRAPTNGQDFKLRGLPINPSLLKGWGHKVPAATPIYIEVITIYL